MSTLVGKKFPDISVKAIDEMGDTFSINVLKQATDNNKKVVLFWYPKDFTFVCPTEIHAMVGDTALRIIISSDFSRAVTG